MALITQKDFYWFQINRYSKIIWTNIQETGSDENGKLYSCTVFVNHYTNDTKEYLIKNEWYILNDLRETELTLSALYAKLKQLDEFQLSLDFN